MSVSLPIERIPSLAAVVTDGEVMLANISTGRGFVLNASASFVWSALETPKTIDQICAELCETFEVAPEVCRQAVVTLIDEWRRAGLVRDVE